MGRKPKTRSKFIKEGRVEHSNKYSYDKVNYVNSKTKVTITCPVHGDFEQTPGNHLGGTGCPKCARESAFLTNDAFKKKAVEEHGNKYSYDKVNYVNSKTKVTITCLVHGDFEQNPRNHLCGSGCPKCAREGAFLTNDAFKKKAVEEHGNKYSYDKVNYLNSKTKVTITCPVHGDFKQEPRLHLRGKGCRLCGIESRREKITKDGDEFKKEGTILHGGKYCYDKVEYINGQTKVTITCPVHGDFEQTPNSHLFTNGCYLCGIEAQKDKMSKSEEDFKKESREVHGDTYSYDKVEYINSYTKVTITCPVHGDFEQAPGSHLRGRGCVLCGIEAQSESAAGWSHSRWSEVGESSEYFDSFKTYIVRLENQDERFFKVGKTFNTIYQRFTEIRSKGYKIKSIIVIEGNAEYISTIEVLLKKKCKKVKYTPSVEFGGMQECFSSIDPIRPLLMEEFLT